MTGLGRQNRRRCWPNLRLSRHRERGRRPAWSFVNEVNALVRSRRLTPAQGQALIDAANKIIAQIK